MPYKFKYGCGTSSFECVLHQKRCNVVSERTGLHCKRTATMPYERCWQHIRGIGLRVGRTSLHDRSGHRLKFKGLFAHASASRIAVRGRVWDNASRPQRRNLGRDRFSRVVFFKDDPIHTMAGEAISPSTLNQKYPGNCTAPYTVSAENFHQDSACIRSVSAFANAPSNGRRPNAELVDDVVNGVTRFYLVAKKNIYANQEILTSYGRGYRFTGYTHSTQYVRPIS